MKKYSEFKKINNFDLPNEINPERVQLCLEVPNEKYHLRAFWTALNRLGMWQSWEADAQKRATLAAAVWREVIEIAYRRNEFLNGCEDCEECEEMYLLRQNPENTCQLEQSTDGGVNWSLAFDYELCLFDQSINPPLSRIDPVTGREQLSIDEGETWHDAPDPRDKTPLTTDVYASKDDPACWHTYNAVEIIRRMMMDSGDELLIIVTFIANLLLVVITGGAAIPVILTNIVSGILALGLGQAREQMTDERWQELRKIIYCAHDLPGGWSLGAYASIYDQVGQTFPLAAAVGVQGMLSALGYVGLTNAGHLHLVDTVFDCLSIDCGEWWYEFDFTQSNYAQQGFSTQVALYVPGTGYQSVAGGCANASECLFFSMTGQDLHPSAVINGWIVEWASAGYGSFYYNFRYGQNLASVFNWAGHSEQVVDLSNALPEGSVLNWGINWGAGAFGHTHIKRLVLHGTGVNPFGADNYIYDPMNP